MIPCRTLHFPFLNRGALASTNPKLVKTQAFKVTLNFVLAPLCPPSPQTHAHFMSCLSTQTFDVLRSACLAMIQLRNY